MLERMIGFFRSKKPARIVNFMLDLETLSTDSNAYIVSIGVVEFDKEGTYSSFYMEVGQDQPGSHISEDTLKWWKNQSPEARSVIMNLDKRPELKEGLHDLLYWIRDIMRARQQALGVELQPAIWGNGAAFDNVILMNAYNREGVTAPWKFWNDRCYRTVRAIFKEVEPAPREGTHHNALADAMYQAEHAARILKYVYG